MSFKSIGGRVCVSIASLAKIDKLHKTDLRNVEIEVETRSGLKNRKYKAVVNRTGVNINVEVEVTKEKGFTAGLVNFFDSSQEAQEVITSDHLAVYIRNQIARNNNDEFVNLAENTQYRDDGTIKSPQPQASLADAVEDSYVILEVEKTSCELKPNTGNFDDKNSSIEASQREFELPPELVVNKETKEIEQIEASEREFELSPELVVNKETKEIEQIEASEREFELSPELVVNKETKEIEQIEHEVEKTSCKLNLNIGNCDYKNSSIEASEHEFELPPELLVNKDTDEIKQIEQFERIEHEFNNIPMLDLHSDSGQNIRLINRVQKQLNAGLEQHKREDELDLEHSFERWEKTERDLKKLDSMVEMLEGLAGL